MYRARIVDPAHDDHGAEVALKLLLHARPDELDEIDRRLAAIAQVADRAVMRPLGAFLGTALTDDPLPDDEDFEVCWVVCEWIEGHRLGDDPADSEPAAALRISSEVARSIHALHTATSADAPAGILHRDVKTSNVRVRTDGSVVIVDFGLSRPAGNDASVVGTPGWLAPEVAAGRPGGRSADVYGVGAVAHHLVVGEPPRRDGRVVATERLDTALRASGVPLASELAVHLAKPLAIDERDRPSDLGHWADELDQLRAGIRPPGARRPPRMTIAAVVLLVLVATASAWALFGRDEPDGASPSGDVVPRSTVQEWKCATEPELADDAIGRRIRQRYDELDKCAGAATPLVDAVTLQLLDRDGEPSGVIVASPVTDAILLSDAQYASYREIAGRADPTNAARFGGYPSAVSTVDGAIRIELSNGGLLLGRRDDTQSFWLPHQARPVWEETGGINGRLGIPTSNPFFIPGGMMRLEFERGFIDATITAERDPGADFVPIFVDVANVQVVEEPRAALDRLGDLRDRVLRQTGGTAWYVDDDEVRHWIRNGSTWGCLQANERLVPGDVQGFAVAALELGPPAQCPG